MSVLKNGNVACLCSWVSLMSHVEFKNRLCTMSLHLFSSCRMSLSPMSHVEFTKRPCRPVNFRGEGHRRDGESIRGAQALSDGVATRGRHRPSQSNQPQYILNTLWKGKLHRKVSRASAQGKFRKSMTRDQ